MKNTFIIPISQDQKTKNACYLALKSPIAKKCIKPEKKINREKIFIKGSTKKDKKK